MGQTIQAAEIENTLEDVRILTELARHFIVGNAMHEVRETGKALTIPEADFDRACAILRALDGFVTHQMAEGGR